MEIFTEELAKSGDLDRAFEGLVSRELGVRLFTIMRLEWATSEAERLYTNQPHDYPVSGRKPIGDDAFTHKLVHEGQTLVQNSIEEIAQNFPDHALIRSLGCESCLNIPVVVAGKVLGSLNFLDRAGFWNEETISRAETLRPAGLIYLLLQSNIAASNDNASAT